MLPCSVTAIAGIFSFDRLIEQLVDPAGAVEQRELGVQVEVDELRHRDSSCDGLFPLDRRRRLRADVVDDAVDALAPRSRCATRCARADRAAAAPSRPSCRRGSRPRESRPCTRRSARRPSRRRSAPAAAPRSSATAACTSRRACTSSATIASARRSSVEPRPASPRRESAPPGPGPGNGWRTTNSSSSPSLRPTARTSSLNSSRSGSTSFIRMRSGRPPTLWWLLISADCPTIDTDSMTSGYSVPCARKSTWPSFAASASKTSMNVAPMIFRFCSGSVTPASRSRNSVDASTNTSGRLQPLEALANLRRLVRAAARRCPRRCTSACRRPRGG